MSCFLCQKPAEKSCENCPDSVYYCSENHYRSHRGLMRQASKKPALSENQENPEEPKVIM